MYTLNIIIIIFVVLMLFLIAIRKINIINKIFVWSLFIFLVSFYFLNRFISIVSYSVWGGIIVINLAIFLGIFLWQRVHKYFSYYIFNVSKTNTNEINNIINKYSTNNCILLNKKGWQYFLEGKKEDIKSLNSMRKNINNYLNLHGKTSIDTWVSVIILCILVILLVKN